MNLLWYPTAWNAYLDWDEVDPTITAKINELIKDISRNSFRGVGKPEPLRGEYAGWWSRRINSRHRLVYRILGSGRDQRIEIVACREHYE